MNGLKDIDEGKDTYDAVSGKVRIFAISQPGFYALAGTIDVHPAFVAVSLHAPVADYYWMGDDSYRNALSYQPTASTSTSDFRLRESLADRRPLSHRCSWARPMVETSTGKWGRWRMLTRIFKYRQPPWTMQIQSSWFPLTDRNPQGFVDIPKARSTDFVEAIQQVYFGGVDGSKIAVRIGD